MVENACNNGIMAELYKCRSYFLNAVHHNQIGFEQTSPCKYSRSAIVLPGTAWMLAGADLL